MGKVETAMGVNLWSLVAPVYDEYRRVESDVISAYSLAHRTKRRRLVTIEQDHHFYVASDISDYWEDESE